jgi:hypothetical protein
VEGGAKQGRAMVLADFFRRLDILQNRSNFVCGFNATRLMESVASMTNASI